MSEGLITCACCGKLVPASNIELTYRRPDDIAVLSQEEREQRCVDSDDLCALDEQRFFVRCLIPLPVQGSSNDYSLGAWAEIARGDYDNVKAAWRDPDQVRMPAISGKLANVIAYHPDSLGMAVAIKLTGATTRPIIKVLDESSGLFLEQKTGISAHRAFDYTDYVRRNSSSRKDDFLLEEEDELEPDQCSCCDQEIRIYSGCIHEDEFVIADYWIRIPKGHDGYFTLAIAIHTDDWDRAAVLLGEASADGLTYWVQTKEKSPWSGFGKFGVLLDRDEVLRDKDKKLFFNVADTIAAKDSRLLAHITPFLTET